MKQHTPKKLMAISPRYNKKRWRHFLSQDKEGIMHIEGVSVRDLQKKYGTPIYVFVEEEIRHRLRTFKNAFDYSKCRLQYACKCNSNLEVLRIVREEGFEFDASSIGEIILGLLADFEPEQITFTNLYKTEQDIYFASEVGVKAITMDSMEELNRTIALSNRGQKKIPIMLRVNPMLHKGKYNTTVQKYGIPYKFLTKAINKVLRADHIEFKGFHFHGSNAIGPRNHMAALSKIMKLVKYAHNKGLKVELLDMGGGFPAEAPRYDNGKYFSPDEFAPVFLKYFRKAFDKAGIEKPTLIFEPGKAIVATSGIGIMKAISIKDLGKKCTIITDGSTYSMLPDVLIAKCWYDYLPATRMNQRRTQKFEIVGCTCDCIDVFEDNEKFPWIEENDLIAVMDCGAYSYVLASNFNNLKKPPMIMIKPDGSTRIIRRRDRYSDMFAPELDVLKLADPYELKKYYDLTRVNIEKLWAGNENDTGNGTDDKSPKAKKRN